MLNNNFIEVPTYNNGLWTITEFQTREQFRDFLLSIFKEPGEYNFDESLVPFNNEILKRNRDKTIDDILK
jgi:hypothetical protein